MVVTRRSIFSQPSGVATRRKLAPLYKFDFDTNTSLHQSQATHGRISVVAPAVTSTRTKKVVVTAVKSKRTQKNMVVNPERATTKIISSCIITKSPPPPDSYRTIPSSSDSDKTIPLSSPLRQSFERDIFGQCNSNLSSDLSDSDDGCLVEVRRMVVRRLHDGTKVNVVERRMERRNK
jgi:hypothetical protein